MNLPKCFFYSANMGQECSSNGCSNAPVRNASNIEKQHDEDGNLTEFEGELQIT